MRSQRNDKSLSVDSLCLLAPPLRLLSAAVWKVMQQHDVMHFGKLEELVTSISETVPGLLNYRHQAKLTVGLGARLILEHLRVSQSPDPKLILPLLERLRAPTPPKGKRKDEKVEMAVKNFHTLVHTLLKNQAEKRRFFKEDFEAQYGPQYDCALEKLLWEFLTRLDQLLPVPDLEQTVSWLSSAPAVLEQCARSPIQPQLLKALLQHEKCLGHLDSAASIPSSTGDSILSSLSLGPSGVSQPRSTPKPNTAPAPSTKRSSTRQTSRIVSQIAPVIGTISSNDLPKRSASQSRLSIMERDSEEEKLTKEASSYTRVKTRSSPKTDVPEKEDFLGNMLIMVLSQTSTSSEIEDSDESQRKPVRKSAGRRSLTKKRETRSSTRVLEPDRTKKENADESQRTAQDVTSHEGKDLLAVLSTHTKRQLRVVIPRLNIKDFTPPVFPNTVSNEEQATESPNQSSTNQSSTKHVIKRRNGDSINRKRKLMRTPEKNFTDTTDKQICAGSPCIPTVKPVKWDSSEKVFASVESTDDIIVDSEDEATENVKGRLFTTRYCKTKNNTYIPTLNEFWNPFLYRRDIVSPGNGSR